MQKQLSVMKKIILLCIIVFLFGMIGCTPADSDAKIGDVIDSAPPSVHTPAPPSEPLYTIGVALAAEGSYVYAYSQKDTSSKIVGAAAGGIRFAVIEYTDRWCEVLYDGETAYVPSAKLDVTPELAPLPQHKAYYFVPECEDVGYVHRRFDNKLTVQTVSFRDSAGNLRKRLDVYKSDGKILSQDATIVIEDGTITGPPLPSMMLDSLFVPSTEYASMVRRLSGSRFLTHEMQFETTDPEPDITPEPEPTPTPTPVPVSITVRRGKVAISDGISLSKDRNFIIGEDYGKVIASDQTVIGYDDLFWETAVITLTNGSVYNSNTNIIIEPSYYFEPVMLPDNLVDVRLYAPDIHIDMVFAKDDNVMGDALYEHAVCLLQKGTLEKLITAQELFAKDGYTIVIYDAYRPYSVTVAMYEKYQNPTYVARPRFGSDHNRGAAVDISLLNSSGEPVEMPSPMHTFNATSHRNSRQMSKEAKANMEYMTQIMRSCGFTTINSEWWHFSDSDALSYLRTDHDLNNILKIIY